MCFGFSYSQKFGPIWAVPPVFLEIGGSVEFAINFGIGYDTEGFRNWLMNDLGIRKGEMVALNGPNSAEYLMMWFALDGIGAGVSYINCNLTGTPLVHSAKVIIMLGRVVFCCHDS